MLYAVKITQRFQEVSAVLLKLIILTHVRTCKDTKDKNIDFRKTLLNWLVLKKKKKFISTEKNQQNLILFLILFFRILFYNFIIIILK